MLKGDGWMKRKKNFFERNIKSCYLHCVAFSWITYKLFALRDVFDCARSCVGFHRFLLQRRISKDFSFQKHLSFTDNHITSSSPRRLPLRHRPGLLGQGFICGHEFPRSGPDPVLFDDPHIPIRSLGFCAEWHGAPTQPIPFRRWFLASVVIIWIFALWHDCFLFMKFKKNARNCLTEKVLLHLGPPIEIKNPDRGCDGVGVRMQTSFDLWRLTWTSWG
jgi:hypothetical protein